MIVPTSRRIASRLRFTFELNDGRGHARSLPMEGLRGLAVTLVFLEHFSAQAAIVGLPPGFTAAFAAAFNDYGNMGVELFFLLSGYLIYDSLIRRSPPFIDFMRRRIVRIYPVFLVVFAVALAVTIAAPTPGKAIPADPIQASFYIGANLALLPGLFPIVRIVDVAWSLSYEMFFYVLVAAGAALTRPLIGAASTRIVMLIALSAAFLAACCAGIPYVPMRMMPFFAGMLLAEGLGLRVPAWAGWLAPVAAFIVTVTCGLAPVPRELLNTAAFFMLCGVCFRDAGSVSSCMRWAPLRWLGNMSYSYYLVHGFVVRTAMVLVAMALPHGLSVAGFWTILALLYPATIAASALMFVYVEKPMSLQPNRMPRSRWLLQQLGLARRSPSAGGDLTM